VSCYFDSHAQDKATIKRLDSLSLTDYLESPIYFINKDYVVFEYKKIKKIIYADMSSFHVLPYANESGIACDKNGVYFQGDFLKIDTTGLKFVGVAGEYENNKLFWKTSDKVFQNLIERNDIDAKTFQSIGSGYFRDKNYVYYYDVKITGSDPGTISGTYNAKVYYDKNNIYNKGKIMYYHDKKLSAVNYTISKAEHEIIANYAFLEEAYYINRQTRVVSSIDAPSLKGLSRFYSMDKYHVYFDTTALPIKPENFKHIKVWDQANRSYISDGVHVYSGTELDTSFDAPSFGMLPHSDFCFDKNGVYEKKWIEAKKTSVYWKFPFNYTNNVSLANTYVTRYHYRYIVYEHQVYDLQDEKLFFNLTNEELTMLKAGNLINLDKTKQQVDGSAYFIIDNKLYKWRNEIKNIDIKSVKYIDDNHIADKYHVYMVENSVKTGVIPGADAATFTPFIYGFYRDKSNIFNGLNKLIGSEDVELLAIFCGVRESGDEGDGPFSNYCLFKNRDGYWLVETARTPIIDYLGKTFNRKLNKAFVNFQLPDHSKIK
jgi:hypothetical protein